MKLKIKTCFQQNAVCEWDNTLFLTAQSRVVFFSSFLDHFADRSIRAYQSQNQSFIWVWLAGAA